MLLWVAFAVLTAFAALAIVWPLARADRDRSADAEGDVAVYREQLKALDNEISRGVLSAEEAAAAKVEISRRMLAAAERRDRDAGKPAGIRLSSGTLASALVIAVTGGSLALYLTYGAPDMPGEPLSARLDASPENQSVDELVARVENHLADHPDDGQGWEVIAPVYMRTGRLEDAARAYANAARLLGENGDRLAGLGEALTLVNQGIVTAEARSAFARAAKLEPGLVRARFYLALGLEQDGKRDEAIAAWNKLLEGSPADAPWRGIVEQKLAALGAAPPAAAPGPSAADVAAAQDMSAEDRNDMINQMVARLAARLAEDGKDLDGWLRLARAYSVLGRQDDARAALASARENFSADEAALSKIKAFEAEAGLGS